MHSVYNLLYGRNKWNLRNCVHFTSLSWQSGWSLEVNFLLILYKIKHFQHIRTLIFQVTGVTWSHQHAWMYFFEIHNSFQINQASVFLFSQFVITLTHCKYSTKTGLRIPAFHTHTDIKQQLSARPCGSKAKRSTGGRWEDQCWAGVLVLYKQLWGRLEFEVSVNDN